MATRERSKLTLDAVTIDNGEALALKEPMRSFGSRSYLLRTNDILLKIGAESVQRISPDQFEMLKVGALSVTPADPGEAWEYLHGDYEPTITHACIACGAKAQDEPIECGCPVGIEPFRADWPSIPSRQPRAVHDGELRLEDTSTGRAPTDRYEP